MQQGPQQPPWWHIVLQCTAAMPETGCAGLAYVASVRSSAFVHCILLLLLTAAAAAATAAAAAAAAAAASGEAVG
jgi:hypothetical protein